MLGITPGLLLTVYVAGKQLPFQLQHIKRFANVTAAQSLQLILTLPAKEWGAESDRIIIATPFPGSTSTGMI